MCSLCLSHSPCKITNRQLRRLTSSVSASLTLGSSGSELSSDLASVRCRFCGGGGRLPSASWGALLMSSNLRCKFWAKFCWVLRRACNSRAAWGTLCKRWHDQIKETVCTRRRDLGVVFSSNRKLFSSFSGVDLGLLGIIEMNRTWKWKEMWLEHRFKYLSLSNGSNDDAWSPILPCQLCQRAVQIQQLTIL